MHYNCKSLHVVIKYLNDLSNVWFHTTLSAQFKFFLLLLQKYYPISTPYCETLRLDKDVIHWEMILITGCAFRKDPRKTTFTLSKLWKTNSFSLVYSSFKCTTRCTPLTFLSIGPGCLAHPPSKVIRTEMLPPSPCPFFPPIFHLLLLLQPKSSSNSLLSQKQPSSSKEIFFA